MQWFTIVGLILDIAGVSLIAWEWFIANYPLSKEWVAAYQAGQRDFIAESDLPDDAKRQYVPSTPEQIAKDLRPQMIRTGVALLILGFVLQIIGAWPT